MPRARLFTACQTHSPCIATAATASVSVRTWAAAGAVLEAAVGEEPVGVGAGGRGGRPPGRGTPDDPDVVQGRPAQEGSNLTALPPPEQVQPWQYALPTEEQLKRNPATLIPPQFRPRVAM